MSPFAPAHPCSFPGCGALVRNGSRCERHRKQEQRQYDRGRAKDPAHTFYSSQRWRAARARQLMDEPLCCECRKLGKYVPATVADHIVPIRMGGDPFGALQSLCASHHSSKSVREGSRYGKR
jgi:5-methylcytosine-specific restriction enzyme A